MQTPLKAGFPASFLTQPSEARAIVWLSYYVGDFGAWAMVAPIGLESVGTPDSVFWTTGGSTEYSAAAHGGRRWVIRSDNYNTVTGGYDPTWHIRVAYSDTTRPWHEVPRLGVNEDHCTVAPLGDTTAMVVYAGQSGLQYAILDGARWSDIGNLDPRPFNASHPELRLRRSGGLWLFWADNDWMHMSTFRNGAWDRGDSIRCAGAPGETFSPTYLDAEQDTTEYPAVAWTNSGYDQTWRDVTAIAFGNGHGWDSGEEIADSELSGAAAPSLTRDLNGDEWLFWRRFHEGTNRWVHTYVSATCPAPSVVPLGGGTRVTWTLTSRAPQSRWTLFRARDGGALDSLATVRAGEDSVLTFDDPAALPGSTWRYAVRRECVDIRYRWTSDTTTYSRADDCAMTCTAPAVVGHGSGTRVTWTLPAMAPDTRWSVLRARDDGPFDSLAALAAGTNMTFTFDDSTAAPGVLWRYALRRDCSYPHEAWTSNAVTFWRADTQAPLTLTLANPTGSTLAFRLSGAAGFVWVKLYDLQGRKVLDQRLSAAGTGQDSFSLDLGGTGARRSGIYFLRVTDQTGRTTPSTRVAVVR